jgi:hypothetical protein
MRPEKPAIHALAKAKVPALYPASPTMRIRLNPARLATLLHTLVPMAKMSAELDMIVAIWNSDKLACRPIEGNVASMTLWPTDVARSAQKSTLKMTVEAEREVDGKRA